MCFFHCHEHRSAVTNPAGWTGTLAWWRITCSLFQYAFTWRISCSLCWGMSNQEAVAAVADLVDRWKECTWFSVNLASGELLQYFASRWSSLHPLFSRLAFVVSIPEIISIWFEITILLLNWYLRHSFWGCLSSFWIRHQWKWNWQR